MSRFRCAACGAPREELPFAIRCCGPTPRGTLAAYDLTRRRAFASPPLDDAAIPNRSAAPAWVRDAAPSEVPVRGD